MIEIRKSLIATLFIASTLMIYVMPELLQLSVILAYISVGITLVLEPKSAYRAALLVIGALYVCIVFVGQISPYPWLIDQRVAFPVAVALTLALLFGTIGLILFLPYLVQRLVAKFRSVRRK